MTFSYSVHVFMNAQLEHHCKWSRSATGKWSCIVNTVTHVSGLNLQQLYQTGAFYGPNLATLFPGRTLCTLCPSCSCPFHDYNEQILAYVCLIWFLTFTGYIPSTTMQCYIVHLAATEMCNWHNLTLRVYSGKLKMKTRSLWLHSNSL